MVHFNDIDPVSRERICALMEECGLVPSCCLTPSLEKLIKIEMELKRKSEDSFFTEERKQFIDLWVANRRKRKHAENIMVGDQLVLFDTNDRK